MRKNFINKDNIVSWLKYSMLVGCVVDLFMVVIFLTPYLRIIVFGESEVVHTPQYEWGMRLIASLGAAWTVLLFWASRRPFERKDILLFTVFPLMFGAYSATVWGLCAGAVSLQFFVLFTIITFGHCPLFLYLWKVAGKIDSQSIEIGSLG